jgi:hypothetical protein
MRHGKEAAEQKLSDEIDESQNTKSGSLEMCKDREI